MPIAAAVAVAAAETPIVAAAVAAGTPIAVVAVAAGIPIAAPVAADEPHFAAAAWERIAAPAAAAG